MDLIQRYAAALHPDTHRVLGRRLRPLTIGHLLLLHRIGSPVITGRGVIDAPAIALVVWLCSMPYRRAARAAAGRWLWMRLAALTLRARCTPAASGQLARYLAAGADRPMWWHNVAMAGGEAATPFWLSVQITLMRDLGRTFDQALDTPASLAMWLCAAVWEERGAIDLVSDEQAELLRAIPPTEFRKKAERQASQN